MVNVDGVKKIQKCRLREFVRRFSNRAKREPLSKDVFELSVLGEQRFHGEILTDSTGDNVLYSP